MMMFVSINGTAKNGGGSIFQYNPSGKQNTALSSLDRPRGLDFDKTNNLFVATNKYDVNTDNIQGTIFKITPGGEISTLAAGFPTNFFLEGLVTDSHGNVFVVGQDQADPNGACTIFLITPGGAISTFGSVPAVPGQSFGLAFDSAGDLFIAETGDAAPGDILEFTPAGARTVFASGLGRPEGNGGAEFLAFKRGGSLLP